MTDVVQIQLQAETVANKWGKALLTPTENGFQIHFNAQDAQRSVQKAARSLDNLGLAQVQLTGDNWTMELQWAFYQGFCSAKKQGGVLFNSDAAQTQLEQLAQCFSWAKHLTNQTPDELYPEQLAKQAAAFITDIAPKGTVNSHILLDEQLLEQGWNGLHAVGRGSARKPAMLVLDYPAEFTGERKECDLLLELFCAALGRHGGTRRGW